jgi:hypothetical protein
MGGGLGIGESLVGPWSIPVMATLKGIVLVLESII